MRSPSGGSAKRTPTGSPSPALSPPTRHGARSGAAAGATTGDGFGGALEAAVDRDEPHPLGRQGGGGDQPAGDGGAADDGTIYLRAAGCDWVFVPEGQPASAWTSRLELRGTGSWKEWSLPLPNALIPLLGLVTGILLVFRTAGRTPPRWVIPLLAAVGLVLSVVVSAAISHRGELGTSAYTTCLAFGGCLLLSLVSAARPQRR